MRQEENVQTALSYNRGTRKVPQKAQHRVVLCVSHYVFVSLCQLKAVCTTVYFLGNAHITTFGTCNHVQVTYINPPYVDVKSIPITAGCI